MQQYFDIRAQYPDTLLFFQVGDFYELFFQDAVVASKFLAIALTKRGKCNGEDVPLAGIPVHALRHYLTKLVNGGFRVAICDQLTEATPGTVVERGVTQVLSPGTLTDEQMLDEKRASYLCSFYATGDKWGMVFSELLTAQLYATTIPAGAYRTLEAELARFFPDEIILPSDGPKGHESYFKKLGYWVSKADSLGEKRADAHVWLEQQFDEQSRARVDSDRALSGTFSQLHQYLSNTQQQSLSQFKKVQFYEPGDYLLLDEATQRNLELVKNSQDGGRTSTLLSVMDVSKTAMGSRLLRKWLLRPLMEQSAITARQQVVQALHENTRLRGEVGKILSAMPDLERMVGRIALRKAALQDFLGLRDALVLVPVLRVHVGQLQAPLAQALHGHLQEKAQLRELLQAGLDDSPGTQRVVKPGFDFELDKLRDLVDHAEQKILALEEAEIARSGISSLKIRFNKVHGYYLEVTKVQAGNVPDDFIRSQTLANRERYTTPALQELEREIVHAQREINAKENAVYEHIKEAVREQQGELRRLAGSLCVLDALHSFASVAAEQSYVCPQFTDGRDIVITQGRHPVVEQHLDSPFVPNDTRLVDEESLLVITGPNMGGKSTYLRQVALNCLLAQCGSFVPAQAASLPLVDRIFTRIGSGDDVAAGKSTFLVEMEETAVICTQATERSLVILDEVGRGTSTRDGLSIAQAVIEYLYTRVQARCLFATHYQELTLLSDQHTGIANYYMASQQEGERIVFLHQIAPGVAAGSFGLEVAKLAGLPKEIVARAGELLHMPQAQMPVAPAFIPAQESVIEQELKKIDLDELTPRQAFDVLWKLQKKVG